MRGYAVLFMARNGPLSAPTSQPAPIPDLYVQAKAALDVLVAAIGVDPQQVA